MVKERNVKELLKEIECLLILSQYNHLFLYDQKFWRYHFKAWKLIFLYNRSKPKKKLKQISLFIWLKFIPFLILFWYIISFTILIGLNLEGANKNLLFLTHFPHTLLIFWVYHKIANYVISMYYMKIQYNIDVLSNRKR